MNDDPQTYERYRGFGITEFCRRLPDGNLHYGLEIQTYRHNGATFAILPEPFYFGLIPWAWKRLTRWRDPYGRKAQLLRGE
jgi:hypothetical protein